MCASTAPLHASNIQAFPPAAAIEEKIADERRVTVGHDGSEFDACGAVGRVRALDPEIEDMLSVRAAPDLAGAKRDKLAAATLVWLCEAEGEWQGIVYPTEANQDLGDCRLGSPVAAPEPYAGPCSHGWVQARYIELVAG